MISTHEPHFFMTFYSLISRRLVAPDSQVDITVSLSVKRRQGSILGITDLFDSANSLRKPQFEIAPLPLSQERRQPLLSSAIRVRESTACQPLTEPELRIVTNTPPLTLVVFYHNRRMFPCVRWTEANSSS